MNSHDCPSCGGPACPYCGNRLTVINDSLNCRACIERSIKELGEYMRARTGTSS